MWFRFATKSLPRIRCAVKGNGARSRDVRGRLLLDPLHRWEYVRTGLATIRDIVAIGIILDVVAQFLIFGQVHPGAALLIGPVLVTAPYAIARALTNRMARMIERRESP